MSIQYGFHRIKMWSFLGFVSVEVKKMLKIKASSKHDSESIPSIDLHRWMTQLPTDIKDRPLASLTIPGSHDSGGYSLTTRYGLAPDNKAIRDVWWFKYFPRVALMITKRWCQTQAVSIIDQLHHGIRYFDLRGGPLVIEGARQTYTNDISLGCEAYASTLDLYFVHGIYGPRLYDMLKSISQFLTENPGEVVILHFQHFHAVNEQMINHLMNHLISLFGTKICPHKESSQSPSLKNLISKGYQVIVFFPIEMKESYKHPLIWPAELLPNPWANTTSLVYLQSFLQYEQSQRDPDRFFVTQGVLTPDNEYIKHHLPFTLKTSLAAKCNNFLMSWLDTTFPGMTGPNIVMCDFVEFKDYSLPRKIVQLNYTYENSVKKKK